MCYYAFVSWFKENVLRVILYFGRIRMKKTRSIWDFKQAEESGYTST